MRVAVVFDNFGPYHLARLLEAARQFDVLGVEVRGKSAVYDWDTPESPAALKRVRLFEAGNTAVDRWSPMHAALDAYVAPFYPHVVAIPGWATLAALAATAWALRRDIPVIVMSESNAWDFGRSTVRELVKRRILRSFSAALCAGASHKDYLVELGLDPEAIFLGYDAVDNNYFSASADRVRADGQMPELAPGDRLDPKWRGRYFLASARFIKKKNLHGLLEAYAAMRERVGEHADTWPLVVLGDGELWPELERRRRALRLDSHVYFPGFRQYRDLPAFYGTAGAFVHASTTEQWGLVVNEAMASGLPVLVSERCGCADSLVRDGVNGFTFDPDNIQELAQLMFRIQQRGDHTEMGQASRAILADWGPERFGKGLYDAARHATERGSLRTSLAQGQFLWAVAAVRARRP